MVADWLRVADIIDDSIVDGPGLRLTVFTQGCPRRCKGCHNPGTHDPAGGRMMPIEEIWEQYRDNPLLSGITFSGGEPFLQPEPLSNLARLVHASGGDVIAYTGYYFEELLNPCLRDRVLPLLEEIDVLIDGPYVEELRSLELRFRGSANQRVLDKSARRELYINYI
ncbi:MAG: anaerobic ribonucleoside-triphosphate reductase activating protein, partial [Desulfovibrio sp.]|nr:anaerobic ribonucleoside-triphosphate reductase activating protein [Desulfovibrio sp.]